ncbi:hypothetical protein SAMN04488498_13917 [Mesorhizobium albiziae]|uniref:Uncharacterized protein n=1 Tax=Neomesorhizobium albiziae TaxID=335020 RepID=A0A1I4FCV9_9HYPH|nr:hypothetical protein SAMN04488498_13917 [Mesorhizobium albiziae]
MNRTINDIPAKRFYCEKNNHLRRHIADWVSAYDFAVGSRSSKALHSMSSFARDGSHSPTRQITII